MGTAKILGGQRGKKVSGRHFFQVLAIINPQQAEVKKLHFQQQIGAKIPQVDNFSDFSFFERYCEKSPRGKVKKTKNSVA